MKAEIQRVLTAKRMKGKVKGKVKGGVKGGVKGEVIQGEA